MSLCPAAEPRRGQGDRAARAPAAGTAHALAANGLQAGNGGGKDPQDMQPLPRRRNPTGGGTVPTKVTFPLPSPWELL